MKKKIFGIVLAFLMIVPCALIFTGCGKDNNNKKLSKLEIKYGTTQGVNVTYSENTLYYGNTLPFSMSDIKPIAIYKDGKSKTASKLDDGGLYFIEPGQTNEQLLQKKPTSFPHNLDVGTYILKYTLKNKTATFTFEIVPSPYLFSLQILSPSFKYGQRFEKAIATRNTSTGTEDLDIVYDNNFGYKSSDNRAVLYYLRDNEIADYEACMSVDEQLSYLLSHGAPVNLKDLKSESNGSKSYHVFARIEASGNIADSASSTQRIDVERGIFNFDTPNAKDYDWLHTDLYTTYQKYGDVTLDEVGLKFNNKFYDTYGTEVSPIIEYDPNNSPKFNSSSTGTIQITLSAPYYESLTFNIAKPTLPKGTITEVDNSLNYTVPYSDSSLQPIIAKMQNITNEQAQRILKIQVGNYQNEEPISFLGEALFEITSEGFVKIIGDKNNPSSNFVNSGKYAYKISFRLEENSPNPISNFETYWISGHENGVIKYEITSIKPFASFADTAINTTDTNGNEEAFLSTGWKDNASFKLSTGLPTSVFENYQTAENQIIVELDSTYDNAATNISRCNFSVTYDASNPQNAAFIITLKNIDGVSNGFVDESKIYNCKAYIKLTFVSSNSNYDGGFIRANCEYHNVEYIMNNNFSTQKTLDGALTYAEHFAFFIETGNTNLTWTIEYESTPDVWETLDLETKPASGINVRFTLNKTGSQTPVYQNECVIYGTVV